MELTIRKKNNLPPFVRLIAIIVSSNQHGLSIKGAKEIKVQLKKISNIGKTIITVKKYLAQTT